MMLKLLHNALICAALIAVLLLGSALSVGAADRSLFLALRTADTPQKAALIAEEIRRHWRSEAGATASLLLDHADALIEAGDLRTARRKLTGVVEVQPDYADGWARRGVFLRSLGRDGEALSDLEMAVSLDPDHFAAHALIGEIREAEEDWGAALEAYRAAHDLYPLLPRPAHKTRVLGQLMGTDG
ncbi:MAG: tetratricopeptide repeat protein [Alphaproteobacteria bacterium]